MESCQTGIGKRTILNKTMLESVVLCVMRSLQKKKDLAGYAERSVSDRLARDAGAALGKFEIDWLFPHLPALLRRLWLCSMVTELPAWPLVRYFFQFPGTRYILEAMN